MTSVDLNSGRPTVTGAASSDSGEAKKTKTNGRDLFLDLNFNKLSWKIKKDENPKDKNPRFSNRKRRKELGEVYPKRKCHTWPFAGP
ncbi:hypothetical protein R6Q59_036009 [Mikania micrantha]